MNINNYRKRFYNLLESKLGDVRPLICENEIGEDTIDLTQTYLSPERVSSLKDENKRDGSTKNSVSSIKGNQFKNAVSSSGNKYGIDFEPKSGSEGTYKVIFSSEFIQKYFSLPTSQVLGQLGPYGDEHGDKEIPMNTQKDYYSEKLTSITNLLNDVYIKSEGYPTNRIHFYPGLPASLRGAGLGYIVYESFIKYLGWGSSQPNASQLAQVIWSKLVTDPDFYSFVIESPSQCIYVISKENTLYPPDEIVKNILNHFQNNDVKIKLGDELKKDYPDLIRITENPLLEIFNNVFRNLKLNIEYVISLKDRDYTNINNLLSGSIQKQITQIIHILTSEDHPYPLFKSIYDEVSSLFKKFIDTYFISNSVSFENYDFKKWKRKGKDGNELKLDSSRSR